MSLSVVGMILIAILEMKNTGKSPKISQPICVVARIKTKMVHLKYDQSL